MADGNVSGELRLMYSGLTERWLVGLGVCQPSEKLSSYRGCGYDSRLEFKSTDAGGEIAVS